MGSQSGDKVDMSSVEETKSSDPTVEIKVKTLDSQTYTLRVDKCVPVPTLKEQVATVTGILSERQRLICRGRVLKDDQLLSAYHVEDGHTLHLVVREPNLPSQNMNDHTGPDFPPSAAGTQGAPRDPRVFVRTINMSDQMQGGHLGILSSLLSSMGAPLTGNGSVTTGAQEIPDSLTTLFQYLNQLTADFAFADVSGEEGTVVWPEPSSVTYRRGLPTAESLAGVLRSTRQLFISQTAPTLSRLATDLQFHVNVTDASDRRALQSIATRSGIMFRNLGALFLELGRTVMMLRMGPTSDDAVVNAGSAVFVNESEPNPIMVQPFPALRNAEIRIPNGVFPGATSHGDRTRQQLYPEHVRQSQAPTGITPTPSSGLPDLNTRLFNIYGVMPEPLSPGLDSPVTASPQPSSPNSTDIGGSGTGGLGGGQSGTVNGGPASAFQNWVESNDSFDEFEYLQSMFDIADEQPPTLQTAAASTIVQPIVSAGASASPSQIPLSPSNDGIFISNPPRHLMPYISQNSASHSAAGPITAGDDSKGGQVNISHGTGNVRPSSPSQNDEPSSSDSKRQRGTGNVRPSSPIQNDEPSSSDSKRQRRE